MASNRGFTLIEVIISVAILSLIMGISYSALSAIMRSKSLLDEQRDSRSVSDVVLLRLVRELQLASPGDALLPPRDNLDQKTPSSLVLKGESKEMQGDRRGDSVTFIARSGGQYLSDGSGNTGIVQISYRVEEDPDARSEEAGYYLVREEVPYINPPDVAYKRSIVFPLTNKLRSLSFRYLAADTKAWNPTWGVEQRVGLPAAIELTLELFSPSGRVERLVTAVPLRRTE